MKTPLYIPKFHEVAKEAVVVLGGALLAALIIGQVPQLKTWIKEQWTNTPT